MELEESWEGSGCEVEGPGWERVDKSSPEDVPSS